MVGGGMHTPHLHLDPPLNSCLTRRMKSRQYLRLLFKLQSKYTRSFKNSDEVDINSFKSWLIVLGPAWETRCVYAESFESELIRVNASLFDAGLRKLLFISMLFLD